MTPGVPALMCFAGASVFFAASIALQRKGVRMQRPPSVPDAALEARMKRNRVASWICIVVGTVLVAGALFLESHGLAA